MRSRISINKGRLNRKKESFLTRRMICSWQKGEKEPKMIKSWGLRTDAKSLYNIPGFVDFDFAAFSDRLDGTVKKNKKIKKFLSFFEKNDEECCQQIRAQAVKRLCTLFGPRCLVHMRKRWTNFQTCWVSHATFWIELPWEERHPDWSLECAAETLKTRPVWGLKFPSLAKKILWDFPVALDHSATVQCALKD